jgi:hypothetical protein
MRGKGHGDLAALAAAAALLQARINVISSEYAQVWTFEPPTFANVVVIRELYLGNLDNGHYLSIVLRDNAPAAAAAAPQWQAALRSMLRTHAALFGQPPVAFAAPQPAHASRTPLFAHSDFASTTPERGRATARARPCGRHLRAVAELTSERARRQRVPRPRPRSKIAASAAASSTPRPPLTSRATLL